MLPWGHVTLLTQWVLCSFYCCQSDFYDAVSRRGVSPVWWGRGSSCAGGGHSSSLPADTNVSRPAGALVSAANKRYDLVIRWSHSVKVGSIQDWDRVWWGLQGGQSGWTQG